MPERVGRRGEQPRRPGQRRARAGKLQECAAVERHNARFAAVHDLHPVVRRIIERLRIILSESRFTSRIASGTGFFGIMRQRVRRQPLRSRCPPGFTIDSEKCGPSDQGHDTAVGVTLQANLSLPLVE